MFPTEWVEIVRGHRPKSDSGLWLPDTVPVDQRQRDQVKDVLRNP